MPPITMPIFMWSQNQITSLVLIVYLTSVVKPSGQKLLHYTMSFAGGIFAIYALLKHSNVFGSAETSNMILLVNDLLQWDLFHIIIRFISLIVYALGIIFTLWMAKYHPAIQKRLCIIIDCLAALILGFLPENIHPVIALYPVAFAMSIQWCSFRGVRENPSATTFSTGNFRQLVTTIFNYITERNREDLHRIKFYIVTMLSFHAGVAVIYIVWPHLPHQSIWIVFIPLALAIIQEFRIATHRDLLTQNSGCEDV